MIIFIGYVLNVKKILNITKNLFAVPQKMVIEHKRITNQIDILGVTETSLHHITLKIST